MEHHFAVSCILSISPRSIHLLWQVCLYVCHACLEAAWTGAYGRQRSRVYGACGGQRSISPFGVFFNHFPLLSEPEANQLRTLDWVTSKLQESSCLRLPSAEIISMLPQLAFHMSAGNPDSGPMLAEVCSQSHLHYIKNKTKQNSFPWDY